MTFRPTQSPVYGGDTLYVTLTSEHLSQLSETSTAYSDNPDTAADVPHPSTTNRLGHQNGRYFVVFEGSRRRHVVSAWPSRSGRRPRSITADDSLNSGNVFEGRPSLGSGDESEQDNNCLHLQTLIPGHDIAEEVHVTLVQLVEEEICEEDENYAIGTSERANSSSRPFDSEGNPKLSMNDETDDDHQGRLEEDKGGGTPDMVTVTVHQTHIPLCTGVLRYEYDSTFYLTKFLTSSVYNDHALDNLELIKSDRFDLSNEVLSTLDVRLDRALRHANIASGDWHLLGGDSIHDAHCEERETLLHLCARLGLRRVAAFLLERPGSEDALHLCNRHGELPCSLARLHGYHDLAEMLSGYNTHGMVTAGQQDVVEMENAVLHSHGDGSATLTSFLDSPTLDRGVEHEINFLRETEEMIRVQQGILPQGNYNSDWPAHTPAPQLQAGTSRSMPSLPLSEHDVEASLDRVLRQQTVNRESLHAYLRGSSSATSLPHASPALQPSGEVGAGFQSTNAHQKEDNVFLDDKDAAVGTLTRNSGEDGDTEIKVQSGRTQTFSSTQQTSPDPFSSSTFVSTSSSDATATSDQPSVALPASRPTSLQHPGLPLMISSSAGEEIVGDARMDYGLYGRSLEGVRDLTESLFQVREAELPQRLALRERRRRQIGRHSSSCPSLHTPFTLHALSPIDETDHHKSMHDLVEELGTATRISSSSLPQDQRVPSPGVEDVFAASPKSATDQTTYPDTDQQHQPSPQPHQHLDNQVGTGDKPIRICINGVTVDSSEDLLSAVSKSENRGLTRKDVEITSKSAGSAEIKGKGHSVRSNSDPSNGPNETDPHNSHGSWCHDRDAVRSGLPVDRRDQQTRVRMLAMTGKSLSLNSLDGSEGTDEEDLLLNSPTEPVVSSQETSSVVVTHQPPLAPHHLPPASAPMMTTASSARQQRQRRQQHARATRALSDAEFETSKKTAPSPADSTSSSPSARELSGDLGLSSHNARSLSDITITAVSSASGGKSESSHSHSSSSIAAAATRAHHSYDDGTALVVPHTNMTKSLSTPSIPQATEVSASTSGRREGKQHHDAKAFQTLLDDYNAQFRRQKEIEEEEEDDASGGNRDKKAEISWRDFLNEEQSPNDSDEKSSKGLRKEEKKRKPSVFSRFQSSYRTKKNKDKDSKSKHRFVAISFSNATACDVCHKPMANKAALRCENCLVNVHEHNCKDQVIQCDKNRTKALQRDGSAHGAHGPREATISNQGGALTEQRQAATAQQPQQHGTSLRPSQSFKDKRSSSAPVKAQPPGQLTAPPQLSHRHSLPTSSKAISEEQEGDASSTTSATSTTIMETSTSTPPPSNMTDTISESLESLDGVGPPEVSWLEDEPDLQLAIEEPEAWSITVDRKTLKKLGTKDIKRQDTIWELINTEKQYVKRLKIMQKIFSQSMLQDLNFTQEQVDRLFPRLDELVALHADFLRQLLIRQAKNEDRFVDDIGDLLLSQFQDSNAEKMKTLYGVFCSKHTEAMQLYKEFLKVDRKFQNFAKKCTNLSVCEKRDISDFILGVTVRLSKYPILIEAILKSTKDKRDRENLGKAVLMSKEVVQHVDEKVAAYEKLLDIVSKMESRAVTFKGKKFKRQDFNAEGRELLHSGKIGWKSARGRIYDVLAVVLSDIIVFLQKNEQKYTFLMQDNKSCVISLYRLLVREKRDARDSLGIYMISPNRTTPEMYELVCSSKAEREDWIRILQEAIRACPADVEPDDPYVSGGASGAAAPSSQAAATALAVSLEQERRKREEHANHIKLLIERLHEKDDAIKLCCDEKSKLMLELLELSTPRNEPGSRPNSQEIVSANESVDIVQAAMEEASRLTTILQGSGTQLSRSVSSVGEHHSSTFVATPVPKRAETFAGFDSSHESPKMSVVKQRYASGQDTEIIHGRSPSDISMDQPEVDPGLVDMPEAPNQTQRDMTMQAVQQVMSSSQHSTGSATLWEEPTSQQQPQVQTHPPLQTHHTLPQLLGSDRSSDRESLGELSTTSVSSLVIPTSSSPSNHEQMTSIYHLVQYLNTLMNLTSKQSTKVESLRAELAEAKAEIAKLSADMQQQQLQSGGSYYGGSGGGVGGMGRRNMDKHDQLEELRNLQENISRERQEWDRVKAEDRAQLERDRQQLEQDRQQLEKDKLDLRSKKEDLKREREALQRQIDMWREQGYVVSSAFTDPSHPRHHSGGDLDTRDANRLDAGSSQQSGSRTANHRRSASADFYSTVGISDVENIQGYPAPGNSPGEPQHHQVKSRQPPRLSVGSLSSGASGAVKPPNQPGLPMHLLSARNEQRIGGQNVQRLPLKLSGNSNNTSGSNNSGASLSTSVSSSALLQQGHHQGHVQGSAISPSAAFCAGVQQPFPGRSTSGISRVHSMSAATRFHDGGRGPSSNLARVMKLADPKSKSSSSSSSMTSPTPSSTYQGSKASSSGQHVSPSGKPPTSGSRSASGKPPTMPPPQSAGAPGAPVPAQQPGQEGPGGIIYF